MHGDYSRGHEPDGKRGRTYRRVLLEQGRPVLDSDVAALVDALLGEVRTATRGLGCAAGSPDLGFLVTPGRLVTVFAEAAGGLTSIDGTPDAWIDYRHRYLDRYPALYVAGAGGAAARVGIPVVQPIDTTTGSTRVVLWARAEAPVTIEVNGVPVALAPDSPDVPQRFEIEGGGDTFDPLEVLVPAGEEVWLFLLEQDEQAGLAPAFWVAPGTYHLDGLVADARGAGEFPAAAFPETAGFPWTASPGAGPPLAGLVAPDDLAGGDRLVAYLELHERHITHVEDPGIREEALGRYDTSARTELVGQVKLATVPDGGLGADEVRAAFRSITASGGEVEIQAPEATPASDPCALPDVGGYSGSDNRLYRFEVHRGGSLSQVRFKWSRDNGSELFAAREQSGNLVLDAGTPLAAGDLVEVLTHVVDLGDDTLGEVGATTFDPPDRAVGQIAQLVPVDLAGATDEVAFRLGEPDDPNADVILDDRYGDREDGVLKLRRWHGLIEPAQLAADPMGQSGPHVVEDGITMLVSGIGTFRPGQYWQHEARVQAANANGPWRPAPHGPERRFAPLALLEYQGADEPVRLVAWLDERFSRACEITADDVEFHGARVGSESATVQEALEELFEEPEVTGAGCGEFTATAESNLQAVFDEIPAGADARVCIHPGTWNLGSTVTVEDKGHLVIEGAGGATLIRIEGGDCALRIRGCASVRLSDLAVEGGFAGNVGDGLLGALTLENCPEVDLQRVHASCTDAHTRRTSAIEVRGEDGAIAPTVRVRDCRLEPGNAQVGLLVLDVRSAHVQDNVVVTPQTDWTLAQALEDPEVMGVFGRKVFADVRVGESEEFDDEFLVGSPDVVILHEPGEETSSRQLWFHLGAWGNAFVRLWTQLPLDEDAWTQLLADNPMLGDFSDGEAPAGFVHREVRRLRRELVKAMLALDHGLQLTGAVAGALQEFGAPMVEADPGIATGDQGIVVAGVGTRADPDQLSAFGTPLDADPRPDARITGNRVIGFRQGIHVAVSAKSDERRALYRATVHDNTVHLNSRSYARGHHGIFVGNAINVRVGANTIERALPRPEDWAISAHLDAVVAHGWFGPLLHIRGNSCVGTSTGVVANALNSIQDGFAWTVAGNGHIASGGGAAETFNW